MKRWVQALLVASTMISTCGAKFTLYPPPPGGRQEMRPPTVTPLRLTTSKKAHLAQRGHLGSGGVAGTSIGRH